MFKNVVDFVKGDKIASNEEVEQELKQENNASEEKMVQNLKSKLQFQNTEMNTKSNGTIYENDVFINRSNQVKIVKPKSYDNAEVIGEAIKDGKVIILDLNKLETQLATRILDFVTGICFAYNIEPEKVEAKIFMIDPQHKRKR